MRRRAIDHPDFVRGFFLLRSHGFYTFNQLKEWRTEAMGDWDSRTPSQRLAHQRKKDPYYQPIEPNSRNNMRAKRCR